MSCPTVIKKYIFQCPSTEEGVTYTFSNINVTGQGVFSALSGTEVQFKGIASSGSTLTVTNDAPNGTVNLEVNTSAVVAAIPDSTTAVKGKTAFTTDAEAIAKTSTTKALTASNLAALGASTTFAGMTRLATVPEATTGTATDIAVTPAGLKAVVDAVTVTATFANAGARGTATPAYIGQVGVQQDTLVPYIAYGTGVGEWRAYILTVGATNSIFAITTIDIAGFDLNLTNSGATNARMNVIDGGAISFTESGRIQIEGANITGDSVITTAAAGVMSSKLISDFLSNSSANELYTLSNATGSKTLDVSTATASEVADVVASLIQDIEDLKRPTTGV